MSNFSRRRLLEAIGGAGILLPLLHATERPARAADRRKRLVVMAWPEGCIPRHFWPTGTETDFKISDGDLSTLKPLIPHQRDIVVVGGMEQRCLLDMKKGGGHGGKPGLLTGNVVASPAGKDNEQGVSANGPSVDQFVAAELQKRHKLPIASLVLQTTHLKSMERYVSYQGPPIAGKANAPTPEIDVAKLWDGLFAGRALGAMPAPVLRSHRKSVLDYVGRNLAGLGKNLGKEDRARIEQHATSVREIERQLDALARAPVAACATPPRPPADVVFTTGGEGRGAWLSKKMPQLHKAQVDIVVAAMACDLTRVASLLWGDAWNNGYVFWWLGDEFTTAFDPKNTFSGTPYKDHHWIAHESGDGRGLPDSDVRVRRKALVDQWFVSQFAYIVQRFKETVDPDGAPMLDGSLLWCANIFSEGASHRMSDMPWVFAGRAGGYFQTGRFLRNVVPGQLVPQNGFLAHVANAMDVPVERFGDPKYHVEMPRLRG